MLVWMEYLVVEFLGSLLCFVEERRGRGGDRKGVLEGVWVRRREWRSTVFREEERRKRQREKKKKKERKEERHPQRISGRQSPLSENQQPVCALRVRWLVNGFDLYSEKEKERHPKCTTDSQPSLSEDEQPACALRAQRLVVYTSYWGGYFRSCGGEWLFPSGNRAWDQYQVLSMFPAIMLPSLTGALKLECGASIKASAWFPWSSCPPLLVPWSKS